MPSLTLITFPYLIKLISLLSAVLGILDIFVYCSTDMPCQYCVPVLLIQFRAASCVINLLFCRNCWSFNYVIVNPILVDYLLLFIILTSYSLNDSSPSPFNFSLPYPLMPFFPLYYHLSLPGVFHCLNCYNPPRRHYHYT